MSVTNITRLYFSSETSTNDYYKFFVNQGDYQSRTIQANLYISKEKNETPLPYSLTSETVTITYEYVNSSGETVNTAEFECTKAISIGDYVITFLIPNIVVQNYGTVKAQVKIYEDEYTLLNTALFKFYVSESLSVGTFVDDISPLFATTILESGAPTINTVGFVGQFYLNTDNDNLYYCSNVSGSVYTWQYVDGSADYGLITEPATIGTDYTPPTLYTAKGDMLIGSASNNPTALHVGTNGKVLKADSTQTTGVKWDTVLASEVSTTTTGVSVQGELDTHTSQLADNAQHIDIAQNQIIRNEKLNDFVWKPFKKPYIAFCADDLLDDIATVAAEFASYGFKLCLAVPVTSITEPKLSVMQSVVAAGGEVLLHGGSPVTSDNENEEEVMHLLFIERKKVLEDYGFDVQGFITIGGTGWETADLNITEYWLRVGNFSYSDRYGLTTSENYYMPRLALETEIGEFEDLVDECVANNTWLVFRMHALTTLYGVDAGDVDTTGLTALQARLDYVKAYSDAGTLDVVTYKDMYDKYKSTFAETCSPPRNPVALYKMDSGFGDVLYDRAINGKNGELGSASTPDANDPSWDSGGLLFASGDYCTIPVSIDFEQDYTIFFVAKIPASAPGSTIALYSFNSGVANPRNFVIMTTANTLIAGNVDNAGDGASITIDAVSGIRLLRIRKTSGTLYFDDFSDDGNSISGAIPGTISTNTPTQGYIGARNTTGTPGSNFTEHVYAMAIYQRALTDAEDRRMAKYLERELQQRGVVLL